MCCQALTIVVNKVRQDAVRAALPILLPLVALVVHHLGLLLAWAPVNLLLIAASVLHLGIQSLVL
jgi:hypothetical protein